MIKIDYSQLSTFINCPCKYRNKYILKLKKRAYDDRDVAQDWGKAVHSALELLYKGKTVEEAKQIFRTQYVGMPDDKAKTPANGERLIEEYYKYWHNYNSELNDNNLTIVEVEPILEYAIDIDTTWLVKPDLIVKNNAGYWAMDHKTTSNLAYNFFFKFDPNMQISGQCEGVRNKYGQCSGAIINAIGCGSRERAYKGQSAGFWWEFSRDIINRNSTQLEDFKANVCSWCAKLENALQGFGFPKNEDFCHSFKGCQYKEICSSCDDKELIETLYEKHDPFSYLKEEV